MAKMRPGDPEGSARVACADDISAASGWTFRRPAARRGQYVRTGYYGARLLAELRAEYSIDASVYERVYDRDRGMRACVWYMVLWKRALSGKRCERRSPYLNVKAPDARQFRRYPTLSFPAPVEQRCGALPVRLRVRYDSR